MANEMKVFFYEATMVRAFRDGQDALWFVAQDVCDMLKIGDSQMAIERLPDVMKNLIIVDTGDDPQKIQVVRESGLYKLAFMNRMEAAERLPDWLATHVIPLLRPYGIYTTCMETLEAHITEIMKQEEEARKGETAEKQFTNTAPKTYLERFMEYFDKVQKRANAKKLFDAATPKRGGPVLYH